MRYLGWMVAVGMILVATSASAQSTSRSGRAEARQIDQPLRALSPKRLSDRAVQHFIDTGTGDRRWQPAWPGELGAPPPSLESRLLEQLCVDGFDGDATGGPVCRRCPAFTSRGGEEGAFRLEGMVRGTFFEKGASELFVTYRGCEPDRAASGGAVAFRRHKGEWQVFYRHPGLRPDACAVLDVAGNRDQLVCRLQSGSDGRTVDRVFAVGHRGVETLVEAHDDRERCSGDEIRASFLRGWRVTSEKGAPPAISIGKMVRRRPIDSQGEGDSSSDAEATSASASSGEESGESDSSAGGGGPSRSGSGANTGAKACGAGEIEWETRRNTVHTWEFRDGRMREKSVEERAPTDASPPGE